MLMTVIKPAPITIAHSIHRQFSLLATKMRPPISAPSTAPMVGPNEYTACATPRSFFPNMSPTEPAPNVGLVDPATPAKNLKVRSAEILGAKAHKTEKMVKAAREIIYTIRRPNCSDRGARNSGPSPNPRTKMAIGKPLTSMLLEN